MLKGLSRLRSSSYMRLQSVSVNPFTFRSKIVSKKENEIDWWTMIKRSN